MLSSYSNQFNISFDTINPTCTGYSDSPMKDLIKMQAQMDKQEGITDYMDPLTGKSIEFEDYWAEKEFTTKPFYILGKLLRSGAESAVNMVSNSINWALKSISFHTHSMPKDPDQILDKQIAEDPDQILDKQIAEQYKILSKKISESKMEAIKNNKPLMILIGESHDSISSAMIEGIILDIASKNLELKDVLTEAFFEETYGGGVDDSPMALIERKINVMGLNKIFMDYSVCDFVAEDFEIDPDECKNKKGYPQVAHPVLFGAVKVRNDVMADVAIQANVNDTVGIVGKCHLYGMIKETSLSNHFHILPINSNSNSPVGYTYRGIKFEKEKEFFQSEEVLQAAIEETEIAAEYLNAPTMLMEKTRLFHERISVNENLKNQPLEINKKAYVRIK